MHTRDKSDKIVGNNIVFPIHSTKTYTYTRKPKKPRLCKEKQALDRNRIVFFLSPRVPALFKRSF